MKTEKKTTKGTKKTRMEKLEEIQLEKQSNEDETQENPIENGTGIIIVLSGDILIGGFLYKKQLAYKVNKEQFLALEHHAEILGIAIRIV